MVYLPKARQACLDGRRAREDDFLGQYEAIIENIKVWFCPDFHTQNTKNKKAARWGLCFWERKTYW